MSCSLEQYAFKCYLQLLCDFLQIIWDFKEITQKYDNFHKKKRLMRRIVVVVFDAENVSNISSKLIFVHGLAMNQFEQKEKYKNA